VTARQDAARAPGGAPDRRILVVDDETGFRDMLSWNLRGDGVEVDTAKDGLEAQRKLAEEGFGYAMVLTDITMPGVDGLKLLHHIRGLAPSLPVILMTGFGTVEMAVQAMKEGATDFVLKPFDVQGMISRVRRVLGLAVAAG
jgi:DNA-binding NtrC family response regulator